MRRRDIAATLFAALAACGGGEASAVDATTAIDANDDVGPRLGGFTIDLVAAFTASTGETTAAHTTVVGKIYDGVQPETVIWTAQATAGDCTLSVPSVPRCTTPCGATAACVADETCQAYPSSHAVGDVEVTGVKTTAGAAAFTMSPIVNGYQPGAATVLAYPPFTAGDAVAMHATGSDFAPAFTLATHGIAPLELAADPLALASGQPLALTWTAPADATAAVHVKLDISHHGGSKGKIECDTADDGAVAIDASLVDALLALGAAGYPTIIVTRSATGHAAVATGHVDLVAASTVERAVAVPGVTSCTDDTECPSGQSCQPDLTCQ
ncbi:MAG: hypothetical protein K8W52_01810 [Deltaproteobacteria bacterium]|nr:hypothetical protein [Deltaproteobacteria bacterium]